VRNSSYYLFIHMSSPLYLLVDRIHTASGRPPMSTKVIAIDGPGGSGKSTLAEYLSRALGNAPVIHTDDFANWEIPLDWWPRFLAQVLEPLAVNRPARYQRYDWPTQRLAEWYEVAPAPIIIIEGVSSSRDAFQPYLSYTIWVETDRAERLRRGLERDGLEKRPQWEAWMAEEDKYIERERPAERADTVIKGTDIYW
jgi:uridine kinase